MLLKLSKTFQLKSPYVWPGHVIKALATLHSSRYIVAVNRGYERIEGTHNFFLGGGAPSAPSAFRL